jgi:hypothetical protein
MSGDAGTFVNGKKVKEHLLSDRDLIQVGKERFTFSESAGENTSRVAVSVAPAAAAPAHGNTSRRVPASPPPAAASSKGNTGRIAAAPPKTDRVERGTGRIAAPAPAAAKTTGRTQKVTGGTKKITARSAAGMGYQTSRSTFAMPSTRKGKMIAAGGVLVVLAIGGIFYAINAGQIKPEEIKAQMAKQLDELRKFKPDQVIEIDAGYERILAEHEPHKKYVLQIYSNIEKEHTKVHQIAADQKTAAKGVQPFLNKYAGLKAKPEEVKAQAQTLYDECRSLIDNFGNTVFVDQLRAIQTELKTILESAGPGWETGMVALQSEVRAHAKKGEFAQALAKINEYGEKFKEKETLELFKKLEEQRAFLKRDSTAFVDREFKKGQKEVSEATLKKEDFKKKLEGFKAGLEGFKEALEKLEAHILTVK